MAGFVFMLYCYDEHGASRMACTTDPRMVVSLAEAVEPRITRSVQNAMQSGFQMFEPVELEHGWGGWVLRVEPLKMC